MKPIIYWIPGPWPGKLAIVPRPRGNDWLEDEVAGWKEAGLDGMVSTLTSSEIEEFGLEEEGNWSRKKGLEFFSFPIVDRGVPESMEQTREFLHGLDQRLTRGMNMAVHCRQGIGRSGLVSAGTLCLAGENLNDSLARIQEVRGVKIPETESQERWLLEFADSITREEVRVGI